MKILKKSLAMILALLMLSSVMAITAFAEDATPDETSNIIYFVNSDKWGAVSAYCFSTAGGDEVAWPGKPATVVDVDNGVFSYDATTFDKIIFNNNGGSFQTADLDATANTGKYYEPQTAKFYDTLQEALEATKSFVPAKYYAIGDKALFGNNWLLKDKTTAMTSLDKDTFTITLNNVKAGTYEYKVNNGTWDECYPADGNSSVTVAEDNSTVTIILNPSKGYPIAGVNSTPEYPAEEPTTVAPTTAEQTTATSATTPAVSEGKLQVTASSNVSTATTTNTYDLSLNKTFTIDFNLKAAQKLLNGQGYLEYDGKVLKLESFEMPNVNNPVINTALADLVRFNHTNITNNEDFTASKVYVKATFSSLVTTASTSVKLVMEELNGTDGTNDTAYVTNGSVAGSFTMASAMSTPVVPTQAPKLNKISVKLNAGKTYTLKVNNKPSGAKVTYTSSKKKVATVTSAGKVTALTKGKTVVTVKVKTSAKTYTLKSTVTVKSNPKLSKKTVTVKKGKTVKVKITGKASTVNNKYKVASKKIAKITTKSKKATKVVIKGLKKGKTTATITVNGKALKVTVKVK